MLVSFAFFFLFNAACYSVVFSVLRFFDACLLSVLPSFVVVRIFFFGFCFAVFTANYETQFIVRLYVIVVWKFYFETFI